MRKLHHREKVDREIDIHQRLRHDNIVRMYSSFEDAQYIYMVLELCQKKVTEYLMVHIIVIVIGELYAFARFTE